MNEKPAVIPSKGSIVKSSTPRLCDCLWEVVDRPEHVDTQDFDNEEQIWLRLVDKNGCTCALGDPGHIGWSWAKDLKVVDERPIKAVWRDFVQEVMDGRI